MSYEHDSQTRIVLSWLRQDAHEDAERVLLLALDEVDTTPQRRSWWPVRRFVMNTYTKLAMTAAAVVVAAVVGYSLLPNRGETGAPSVSPSATPSASPVSRAMLEQAPPAACGPGASALDCLAPGTYRLTGNVWPGEITMDVPAGWFEWLPFTDRDAYDALLVDAGADGGSGWGLEFNVVDAVSKDPCDSEKGKYTRAEIATVDELVAAMRGWPGFKATTPVPTVVSGYSGKLVALTSTLTATDCPSGSLWTIPQGGGVNAYPMIGARGKARAGTFRIIDINGALLVIRTTDFPDTSPNELANGIPDDPTRHTADQVVMQQILDSIRIAAAPGQP
jgi:hypothetical protein